MSDPLYDAVTAQGTFLEKFSGFIQKLPNLVKALNAQAQGLVSVMHRVDRIEKAMNMASRALPQGQRAPAKVMQFRKSPETQQELATAAASDFDFDSEEDAEFDEENEG